MTERRRKPTLGVLYLSPGPHCSRTCQPYRMPPAIICLQDRKLEGHLLTPAPWGEDL